MFSVINIGKRKAVGRETIRHVIVKQLKYLLYEYSAQFMLLRVIVITTAKKNSF